MESLAADRVRFGHRRDVQILVALIPVILVAMFVTEFNALITPPTLEFFFSDPRDPVFEAQMRDQMLAEFQAQLRAGLPEFAFPASLVKVAGNFGPMIFIGIYLAVALIGGEYEWGTVRTVHLTVSRARTMTVRIVLVIGLVTIGTTIGLLFAAIIPFALAAEGQPLQAYATAVPGLPAEIGIRLLAIVPFMSIPALMSVLGRATGPAFLFTVLFFLADVALTGAPIWASSPFAWVPALTITGSISRLLDASSPLAIIVPAAASVAALLAWSILPAVAAVTRFQRQDLDE